MFTSELKLEFFSAAKILSKIIGNSMPVLGSTACLVKFKSGKDSSMHLWFSTSQALWSMSTLVFSNGTASTSEELVASNINWCQKQTPKYNSKCKTIYLIKWQLTSYEMEVQVQQLLRAEDMIEAFQFPGRGASSWNLKSYQKALGWQIFLLI